MTMADKGMIHFDPEGEKIINQQITEAYQSGFIDSLFEDGHRATEEKSPQPQKK